jgi:hypothetical protein
VTEKTEEFGSDWELPRYEFCWERKPIASVSETPATGAKRTFGRAIKRNAINLVSGVTSGS